MTCKFRLFSLNNKQSIYDILNKNAYFTFRQCSFYIHRFEKKQTETVRREALQIGTVEDEEQQQRYRSKFGRK